MHVFRYFLTFCCSSIENTQSNQQNLHNYKENKLVSHCTTSEIPFNIKTSKNSNLKRSYVEYQSVCDSRAIKYPENPYCYSTKPKVKKEISFTASDVYLMLKNDFLVKLIAEEIHLKKILKQFFSIPYFADQIIMEYFLDVKIEFKQILGNKLIRDIDDALKNHVAEKLCQIQKKISKTISKLCDMHHDTNKCNIYGWNSKFEKFITYLTTNCKIKFHLDEDHYFCISGDEAEKIFNYDIVDLKTYDFLKRYTHIELLISQKQNLFENYIYTSCLNHKFTTIAVNLTMYLVERWMQSQNEIHFFLKNVYEVLNFTQNIIISFIILDYNFYFWKKGSKIELHEERPMSINYEIRIADFYRIRINIRRIIEFYINNEDHLRSEFHFTYIEKIDIILTILETIYNKLTPETSAIHQICLKNSFYNNDNEELNDQIFVSGTDISGNQCLNLSQETIIKNSLIEFDTDSKINIQLNMIQNLKSLVLTGRIRNIRCENTNSLVGIFTHDFTYMNCTNEINSLDKKIIDDNVNKIESKSYTGFEPTNTEYIHVSVFRFYVYFYDFLKITELPGLHPGFFYEDSSFDNMRDEKRTLCCSNSAIEIFGDIPPMIDRLTFDDSRIQSKNNESQILLKFTGPEKSGKIKSVSLTRVQHSQNIIIQSTHNSLNTEMYEMDLRSYICEIRADTVKLDLNRVCGMFQHDVLGEFFLSSREESMLFYHKTITRFTCRYVLFKQNLTVLHMEHIKIYNVCLKPPNMIIIKGKPLNVIVENSSMIMNFEDMGAYEISYMYLQMNSKVSMKKSEEKDSYNFRFEFVEFDVIPSPNNTKYTLNLINCSESEKSSRKTNDSKCRII